MKLPLFLARLRLQRRHRAIDRSALLTLGAVLAVALSWTLALWAQSGATSAAHTLAQAQAALRASDTELAQARELAAALELARPRWKALEAAGVLDGPAPAQWRAAVERLLLRRADAVSAELEFTELQTTAADAAMLPLRSRALELRLALRHEGHLPALLHAIESIPGALVRTSGCRIERQSIADGKALLALCRQRWTTVDAGNTAPAQR